MCENSDNSSIPSDIEELNILFTILQLSEEQKAEVKTIETAKFPDSSEWALGPDGKVIAGSFTQLMLYLTQPDAQNIQFQDEFLKTFPSFAAPILVLASLFLRFFTVPSDAAESNQHRLIQNRIANILRKWIRLGLYQFTPEMKEALFNFHDFVEKSPNYQKYKQIIDSSIAELRGEQRSYLITSKQAPEIQLPPGDPDCWTIQSIPPLELVHQITLLHYSMFKSITCYELLTGIWGEKKGGGCPHLNLMIDYFNRFSNYIQQSILAESGINKRASIYLYWMDVASRFYTVSNFHGVFSVISALTHPCIQRLHQTIKVSQELMGKMDVSFEFMEHICDISNDFAAYRTEFKKAPRPAIPYIGCLQKDLVYTQEAFPNHYMGTNLINFEKCQKCSNLVKEIEDLQNSRYCYKKHDKMQQLISELPEPKTLVELMHLSQEIEKISKTSSIKMFKRPSFSKSSKSLLIQ